jgi:microcystin-dependent protein
MPPFIGQITLVPFDFAPGGWMFCDGSTLSISENVYLFQLIGTTFGGDGQSTFRLPDLRSMTPDKCNYCISLMGNYEERRYEGFTGETIILAVPSKMGNLIECAGQTLQTSQYIFLQALMGTRFGGDGRNNFKMPDLRDKAPAHCRYMMATLGDDPNADKMSDSFVGELLLLPYEVSCEDLRLCNGDSLPVAQNGAIFGLIGTTFGGDGEQTFRLPDLRAVAPSKFNYYIRLRGGVFPPRG